MLSREKIRNKLDDVDSRLCVAFATRCVLRILPLLVDNDVNGDVFWGWNHDGRSKQLLAILSAQQVSLNISAFGKKIMANRPNSAVTSYVEMLESQSVTFAHSSNAYVSAHAVAFASTSAYAYAIQAAYDRSVIVAVAQTATKVAKLYELDIESVILEDLDILQNVDREVSTFFKKREKITSKDYLHSPLWPIAQSDHWRQQQQRFSDAVIALDDGFDIWLDWYEDRLMGKPLDFSLQNQWLMIPEDIKSQGARAANAYIKGH